MSLLSGQRAWVLQRVTAIYAGLYVFLAIAVLLARPPADHGAWVALVTHPVAWLATVAFILLILLHAWIGLRDVILDYVRPVAARLTALVAVALVFLLLGLWALWLLIEAALI
ncbi:MAG: succinate dehydrogenase, hydrophobic membrane anchor protein [Thioalkalivibrio sp.]|nr:succinate dehydrogenase, hydrophobic membrane anchor protein [Thioalkalivibrio sp.]